MAVNMSSRRFVLDSFLLVHCLLALMLSVSSGAVAQERAGDQPHPHDIDQITSLADPEKSLVQALGILGVEIDDRVAGMVRGLRDPFGIIVAARSVGAGAEIPLTTGDVIRTLNGKPMTTLDRLRGALKALSPGTAVALQIQREDRLLFVSFTLDQL